MGQFTAGNRGTSLCFTMTLLAGISDWVARWLNQNSEAARLDLEKAYEAALYICALETEYTGGRSLQPLPAELSHRQRDWLQAEWREALRSLQAHYRRYRRHQPVQLQAGLSVGTTGLRAATVTHEKLQLIDQVLARYERRPARLSLPADSRLMTSQNKPKPPAKPEGDDEYLISQTSFLPRSIFGAFADLRQQLDPQAEDRIVQNFRSRKGKTLVVLRFVLLLVLVPLLTQQISKSFIVGPIVDRLRSEDPEAIFLNYQMEEEAFIKLNQYQELLHFQHYLKEAPPLTEEEIDQRVREKAEEIAIEYRHESSNAIKNIFADLISVIAFAILLLSSREEIQLLKAFIDEVVYGISDSAKAFVIILFTDIFVGFHSPHGWEVILESISRHFGVPENRSFIFLFIATFPVILDTIFKYWIFRYLNRISPSAVATYRNMNE